MKLSCKLLGLGLVLSIILSASPGVAQHKQTAKKPQEKISVTPIDADGLVAVLKRDAPNNKPLLVNFWATWCDPCREEFPDLVKIDKDFRPRGLDFVTVSLDDLQDIKTKVPQFLQQMRATMLAYLLNVPDPEPAINAVDPKWQGDLPARPIPDRSKAAIISSVLKNSWSPWLQPRRTR